MKKEPKEKVEGDKFDEDEPKICIDCGMFMPPEDHVCKPKGEEGLLVESEVGDGAHEVVSVGKITEQGRGLGSLEGWEPASIQEMEENIKCEHCKRRELPRGKPPCSICRDHLAKSYYLPMKAERSCETCVEDGPCDNCLDYSNWKQRGKHLNGWTRTYIWRNE